jgi:anti-sigma regulatory factor (Ser/Thr protein kinase)
VQISGLSQVSGSDIPGSPVLPHLTSLAPGSPGSLAEQQIMLASQPESARVAREFTAAALLAWRLSTVADAAVTIVSELVTNAILYGSCYEADADEPAIVGLILRRTPCELTFIVTDRSTSPPADAATPGPCAESGRGLGVVEALADKWGWTSHGLAAKSVWATIYL